MANKTYSGRSIILLPMSPKSLLSAPRILYLTERQFKANSSWEGTLSISNTTTHHKPERQFNRLQLLIGTLSTDSLRPLTQMGEYSTANAWTPKEALTSWSVIRCQLEWPHIKDRQKPTDPTLSQGSSTVSTRQKSTRRSLNSSISPDKTMTSFDQIRSTRKSIQTETEITSCKQWQMAKLTSSTASLTSPSTPGKQASNITSNIRALTRRTTRPSRDKTESTQCTVTRWNGTNFAE